MVTIKLRKKAVCAMISERVTRFDEYFESISTKEIAPLLNFREDELNWHFGHEGLPSKAQKNFQSHRLVAVVIDLLCRHFGRHVVLAWSLHYTYSGALLKRSLMSCNMYVMS